MYWSVNFVIFAFFFSTLNGQRWTQLDSNDIFKQPDTMRPLYKNPVIIDVNFTHALVQF